MAARRDTVDRGPLTPYQQFILDLYERILVLMELLPPPCDVLLDLCDFLDMLYPDNASEYHWDILLTLSDLFDTFNTTDAVPVPVCAGTAQFTAGEEMHQNDITVHRPAFLPSFVELVTDSKLDDGNSKEMSSVLIGILPPTPVCFMVQNNDAVSSVKFQQHVSDYQPDMLQLNSHMTGSVLPTHILLRQIPLCLVLL